MCICCMCVCVYVCIYVCICMYIHTDIYAYMHTYIQTYTHTHTHTHTQVTSRNLWLHTRLLRMSTRQTRAVALMTWRDNVEKNVLLQDVVEVCVCVCVFIHICIHVYLYTYIHTRVYVYMHVCVCGCVCVCACVILQLIEVMLLCVRLYAAILTHASTVQKGRCTCMTNARVPNECIWRAGEPSQAHSEHQSARVHPAQAPT